MNKRVMHHDAKNLHDNDVQLEKMRQYISFVSFQTF